MNRIRFIVVFLGILLAVSFVEAQTIDTNEYSITPGSIFKSLKLGTFTEVPIYITNTRASPLTFSFSAATDSPEVIDFDKTELVLESGQRGNLTVMLFAENITNYGGTVEISGDADESILWNLSVGGVVGVPVEALVLNVDILKDRVQLGDSLRFKIDAQNLLSGQQYNISLHYSIDNVKEQKSYLFNKSFLTETENVRLDTTVSLIKEFEIPNFLKHGNYVLNVKADFLGLSASSSRRFSVVEAVLDYELLGILRLRWLLFSSIFLVLGGAGFIEYKRRAAKKKRYATQVDYDLLPKPGQRSVFVGMIAETKRKAYFDLEQMTTHTLIAGSTGGGKTVSAEVLVEAALQEGTSVICFDPTAQWTGFLRRNTQKKMFNLYSKFGMKKKDARAFNGNVRQILDAREIIEIERYIKPGEINVFSVSKLDPKDIDILVANTVRQVFKANLPESPLLKLIIIFDEVHRLLPKFGGSGKGFIQIERAAREFRKWGVGLVLISQVLTDFVGETKANINTEIQMRTRDQGDLDRIKDKYGGGMLQSLLKAATGTGMMENSAYNKGNPYFITFRPLLHNHARLSDEELEQYNNYNTVIDELEYQIEQLEQEGLDVFDLRLELKMALDKVKAGAFNMVEIYLGGLLPRLNSEWGKLGKQPKKKETKLVSETELTEELKKAQEERKKAGKKEGVEEVPQYLRLTDGTVVTEALDLMNAIEGMNKETFEEKILKEKDSIVKWFMTKNKELAGKLSKTKTKAEFMAILKKAG